MADPLSESSWKTFTKKHKLELDDKDLLKALAQLEKIDESRHDQRLESAEDLVEVGRKQIVALAKRKKEIEAKLGSKAFDAAKDELYAIVDAAEKLQKQAREAKQQAQDDEAEAESPALLTTKMIPLIRELRKGQTQMFTLVALAGKETVVLISRKAISPARGKLLKEQMSNPGGLKFVRGECLLEHNALTFVMQGQAAGLAKRIKAALLAQTEQRLKIRVRGENPEDVEEDGDEEGEAAAPRADSAIPPAPPRPTARPSPEPQRTGEEGAIFKTRLGSMVPKIRDAQASGHAGAQTAKLKASEAGVFAGKRDFTRANALLDEAEKALAPARPDVSPHAAAEEEFRRAWARAAGDWRDAVETVDGQIARLQSSLRSLKDPELDRISELGLPALTGNFKVRLMAAMMDVDRARGDALKAAAARVGDLASELDMHLEGSDAVKACDDNPFGVQVSIRATLGEAAHGLWRAVEPLQ